MNLYRDTLNALREQPCRWLVTGAAGFIGSNVVRALLLSGQTVVGLDNFSSGKRETVQALSDRLPLDMAARLIFMEGDICDPQICLAACESVDFVLHHAAIGSVPRSLQDPALTEQINVGGFITMLQAAARCNVRRFMYASSSAVYGDGSDAARHEEDRLDPLSPYAVTKYANELYARVLGDFHGLPTIGLRYFNIYGPRQDPQGPYAAVIPRWINALRQGQAVEIHGDGQTVRDFCFVEDVVQANLLAALSAPLPRPHPVYNIASGCPTTLNTLLETLRRALNRSGVNTSHCAAFHTSSRPMDIRVSRADIAAARDELGFVPAFDLEEGLFKTLENNFTDRIVAA